MWRTTKVMLPEKAATASAILSACPRSVKCFSSMRATVSMLRRMASKLFCPDFGIDSRVHVCTFDGRGVASPCINVRELRPIKKNLRGVKYPHQKDNQRSRRAVRRTDSGLAQVKREHKFTRHKQCAGNPGPETHVGPIDRYFRNRFIDQGN